MEGIKRWKKQENAEGPAEQAEILIDLLKANKTGLVKKKLKAIDNHRMVIVPPLNLAEIYL